MIVQAETALVHEDLIDQCRLGSERAHYELYQRYSKAMFNICLRMMRNREEAEDLLQDAFVSAFDHILEYRKDSSFGSWLKRIVINKCINAINKKSVALTELNEQIAEDDSLEDDSVDLLDYESIGIEPIKMAIEQLSVGYRTVLTLYLLEGYDHSEISEILGISESTSKTQYLRAKLKLREILKSNGYER